MVKSTTTNKGQSYILRTPKLKFDLIWNKGIEFITPLRADFVGLHHHLRPFTILNDTIVM